MNSDTATNLTYLFVGAFAAGLATLVANLLVENWKDQKNEKLTKTNYALLLRVELQSALKSINELKSSLEDRSQYLFRWTSVLVKGNDRLETLRSSAFILKDEIVQEDFVSLTTDVSLFVNDVNAIESLHSSDQKDKSLNMEQRKENEDFIKQRRLEKLTELMDLKRRLEDLSRQLDKEKFN